LAGIVVPGPGLDPALDRDLLALAEELAARLGEPVPGHDVVVLGFLLPLADVLVRGDAELRHRLATGEAAHLRVAREAPGQEDPIHGPFLLLGRPTSIGRPCVPAGTMRRQGERSSRVCTDG